MYRRLGLLVAIAAAYFVAGKLGLQLAFFNPSATPVWAPTGIALATLLLAGYDVWPAILVGAFFVNLTTAGSVATSLGIAVGNTVEGLVGAYLVNRFARGRWAFERARNVFRFILLAAVLSTAVCATIGVTTIAFAGMARWADYGSVWVTWGLGDALGDARGVRALRARYAERSAAAVAGVHGRHGGGDAGARRRGEGAAGGGGAAAAPGGERPADGSRELPQAHRRPRGRGPAVESHRAAVRGRALGPGRVEEGQRPTRPSGRQPGPVPRGGSPARLVPGGGHGGAVRGRRVRHRPPGDGGGRRVARGPSGEGASGAGRREACDHGERRRGGVPQGRHDARSPPLVGGSGPLPEQGAPPGEIARSLTPGVRPR